MWGVVGVIGWYNVVVGMKMVIGCMLGISDSKTRSSPDWKHSYSTFPDPHITLGMTEFLMSGGNVCQVSTKTGVPLV